MEIQTNVPLRTRNTFGINAIAHRFVAVHTVAELQNLLPTTEPVLIMGAGSNLLITNDIKNLVIHNCIKGIEIIRQDEQHTYVRAGAGESWHGLVEWCVERDLGGIENLSLIYGTVGAAPVQNIGAYGVELQDVLEELEAVELATGKRRIFRADDCRFGYRESIFKREHKGEYCIISITLRLTQHPTAFNTTYGDIQHTLQQMGIKQPTLKTISQAVMYIRQQKLPNPEVLGNAGSFFKNPIISKRHYKELQEQFPAMPSFPLNETQLKIPAAWLIQQVGWRGKRIDDAGVSPNHALILVNYGNATGQDIKNLACDIIADVHQKFNIMLVPEVNII